MGHFAEVVGGRTYILLVRQFSPFIQGLRNSARHRRKYDSNRHDENNACKMRLMFCQTASNWTRRSVCLAGGGKQGAMKGCSLITKSNAVFAFDATCDATLLVALIMWLQEGFMPRR